MTAPGDWPVVVTHGCADACAEAFGLDDREQARQWLEQLITHRGLVSDRLPASLTGRRSPSGYFLVVDDLLVLPLAADRQGRPQWIATHCIAARHGRSEADRVDPLRWRGPELLAQLNVLPHAVQRFQQRCGGHPDPDRARHELLERIAPTVRAARRPPSWCGTRPAEFYLVAGADDEYCLPCRPGSGARAFDVITCIHRAGDLFTGPARLAALCRLTTATELGSHQQRLITHALTRTARLSWHRPPWAHPHPHPQARWWILFHNRMAAPVAWEPHTQTPLVILGLADHRPLFLRWLSRLRSATAPRRNP
ncbi:MAG: hypothetical protein ACRDRS_15430 [Pseudonocardiaceae bacterium]